MDRVDDYKKSLEQLAFQNYKIFNDVNAAYSDVFQKIMIVIDKIALFKSKRVKRNSQKWFDGEVLGKLNSPDKLFQKFKRSRLCIDKELFKKVKYEVLKLIVTKNQAFYKEKISERIDKPKEIWESLKYLGKPNKTLLSNFNAMEDNDTLTLDTRSIPTVFKNFFSSLAKSFLIKFQNPLDKYNLESVINHYSSFTIADNFCLNQTS